jgi:hypothetical protein
MSNWVHSCCSKSALAAALQNNEVDAIETDIIVSSVTHQAVMAHPPRTHSDFTFDDFMSECVKHNNTVGSSGLKMKNLKLDFKHLGAVRPCLLRVASDKASISDAKTTIWLNADVLPGPGTSANSVSIPADTFVAECQVSFILLPHKPSPLISPITPTGVIPSRNSFTWMENESYSPKRWWAVHDGALWGDEGLVRETRRIGRAWKVKEPRKPHKNKIS